MSKKFEVIDGDNSETAKLVAEIKRDIDSHIENQQVLAQLRHALYSAYVDEGFTEDQALRLLIAELMKVEM